MYSLHYVFQDDYNEHVGNDGNGQALFIKEAWASSEDSDESWATDEDDYPMNIPIPLSASTYTEQEFVACQVAIKISSNMSDRAFLKQINCLLNGLAEKNISRLPRTKYAATKQLAAMAKIPVTYVVYCPECHEICGESFEKPTAATCRECKISLKDELAEGNACFMTISVKKQIQGYLKQKKFRALIRKFSTMSHKHMNGSLHKGLISGGHFDLTLGIDAAQLHNRPGKSFLPAVLFFNNLPISWQLKYPLLAALWSGPTSMKPPRSVFLKFLLVELRKLGTTQKIRWKDDLGRRVKSFTFLTTVISDAPEKADLLDQKGSGTFACPYCFIEGETLTIEKYPRVFRNNPFRRTVGTSKVGGTRYPKCTYEKRFPWRMSKNRLVIGRQVLRRKLDTGKTKLTIKGIKGLPVIRNLPLFEETDGHVPDTLHLVAEGIFKDIMKVMMKGEKGSGHTFLNPMGSWKVFNDMQDSMTKVSETNRNCMHLDKYQEWKGYDYFQFLLHDVALLCSDDTLITNTILYQILIHLSNIIFLSHGDNLQEETIQQVDDEIKKFCKTFKELFTEEFFTYKVHVLQHFPDILRRHGSATYTDGFNLERFVGQMKRLLSTTRLQMRQLCRNFLLKFQSPILEELDDFSEGAKQTLRENGFMDEDFFTKFEDAEKEIEQKNELPLHLKDVIWNCAAKDLNIANPENTPFVRVKRMNRKTILFETEAAVDKKEGKSRINDSLIYLNKETFGQIVEIVKLPHLRKFIFVLSKFQRVYPKKDPGRDDTEIEYPINQFPFEERVRPQYHAFVVDDNVTILKAQVAECNYFRFGQKVRIFSLRPNEWFRF